MPNFYDEKFFASHRAASLESARQVVPFVMELVGCKSVVDVGCGLGAWLSVFQDQGIRDLRGIDGDYVKKDQLLIPAESFSTADLREPLKADRPFDLALSLEVAEHLPAEASGAFVDLLTGFSPVVLFSASVPFQDGTQHINEQWLEYWVALFQERGFRAVDCIRPRFWNDPQVAWWYAQNAVLYVSEKSLPEYPQIKALLEITAPPMSYVHPKFLLHKETRLRQLPPLKEAWRSAFKRTWDALASRLRRDGRS